MTAVHPVTPAEPYYGDAFDRSSKVWIKDGNYNDWRSSTYVVTSTALAALRMSPIAMNGFLAKSLNKRSIALVSLSPQVSLSLLSTNFPR